MFDLPFHGQLLSVSLYTHLGQAADSLLVLRFLLLEPLELFFVLGIPNLQLDLVLVEGIPVEKLLVALQTDLASPGFVVVVLRIWSRLVQAQSTVGLCTELAELQLLDALDCGAASVAHEWDAALH